MTSSDHEILLSINGRLEKLEESVQGMRTEIRQLQEDVHVINTRIDSIEIHGGWLFGGITLIATLMTIVIPAITAFFMRNNSQTQPQVQPQTPQPAFYIMPSEIIPVRTETKSQ